MKIALIHENSQAAKNEMICSTLKSVVEPMGHEVFNYGMYSAEDEHQLTYVQNGILAAVLLNSGAADFVITGCGTGEGDLSGEHFKEYFYANCKDNAIAECVKSIVGE